MNGGIFERKESKKSNGKLKQAVVNTQKISIIAEEVGNDEGQYATDKEGR